MKLRIIISDYFLAHPEEFPRENNQTQETEQEKGTIIEF
jgi:hypothetical protein